MASATSVHTTACNTQVTTVNIWPMGLVVSKSQRLPIATGASGRGIQMKIQKLAFGLLLLLAAAAHVPAVELRVSTVQVDVTPPPGSPILRT